MRNLGPNDAISMTSHSGNISQIELINLPCSNLFQMCFMVGWIWKKTNVG